MKIAAVQRRNLVKDQLEARGIADQRVLKAMGTVPRELFVPEYLADAAYDDRPLPIGAGQTISQPYIVAFMLEAMALESGDKALEVGAGSGYAAAVLSKLAGAVLAIERLPELARFAKRNLCAAACGAVRVRQGDGCQGWPDEAPFDVILVSAGAPSAPETLMYQLKVGGRMIIPVGEDLSCQELVRITRVTENEFEHKNIAPVRFVPLISDSPSDGCSLQ